MQAATPELFSTLPTSLLPIWDAPGKVNAERLAKLLEFSKKDIAEAANVNPHSFSYGGKLPPVVAERLYEWATALELVAGFFDGNADKTVIWFKSPNPLLGDLPPMYLIRIGRAGKLIRIIRDALGGIRP